MGWAIALHGGAGDIPPSLPPERREPREAALRHCLQIGVDAIKAGRSPLDVVELVVRTSANPSFFIYLIFAFIFLFLIAGLVSCYFDRKHFSWWLLLCSY